LTKLLRGLFVERLTLRELVLLTGIGLGAGLIYTQTAGLETVGRGIATLPTAISLPMLIIYALLIYAAAVFVPILAIQIILKEFFYAVGDAMRDFVKAIRAIKCALERGA